MTTFLFMAAVLVVLFGGLYVVVSRQSQQRHDDAAALASAHGWTHTDRDDRWSDTFTTPPFGLGRNRRATNVVEGTHDGRRFVAFDYTYEDPKPTVNRTGASARQVLHPYGVVALDLGAPPAADPAVPDAAAPSSLDRHLDRHLDHGQDGVRRDGSWVVDVEQGRVDLDGVPPRLARLAAIRGDQG